MMLIMVVEKRATGTAGFIATVAVDLFIDGLVLGLGYEAGRTQGLLLTLALPRRCCSSGSPCPPRSGPGADGGRWSPRPSWRS
jgi:hypothetical protein